MGGIDHTKAGMELAKLWQNWGQVLKYKILDSIISKWQGR